MCVERKVSVVAVAAVIAVAAAGCIRGRCESGRSDGDKGFELNWCKAIFSLPR